MLDHVASEMWAVLIGDRDRASAFASLIARYDVDAERLAADLAAFSRRCVNAGLLQAGSSAQATPPAAPATHVRRPGVVGALRCLIATTWSMSHRGFAPTYARYGAMPRAAGADSIEPALAAFAAAENLFIVPRAPDDCLIRSLALFRFLNESGASAHHVIGVRRFPFRAHAWVEARGRALLHGAEPGFTPLARL